MIYKLSLYIFSLFFLFSCKKEKVENSKLDIQSKNIKSLKIKVSAINNSVTIKKKEMNVVSFTKEEKGRYKYKIEREDKEINPPLIYNKIHNKVIFIEFYMDFTTFSNLPPSYRALFDKKLLNFSLPGILIDEKHILTNYDILKDASLIFLKEGKLPLSIKGYDETLNLSILESKKKIAGEIVVLKKNQIFSGDQIFSLGTINGVRTIFKTGIINILHYSEFDEVIDSFFVPTLSPIVNIASIVFNSYGEIIGIVSSYNPYYENSAYVISSNILVSMIKKLKRGFITKSQGWIGIHIKKGSKKLIIKKVLKGSPAEIIGLKKGDILLQINKIKLKDRLHLKKILSFLKPENSIILKIKRGNKVFKKKLIVSYKPLK